MADPVQSVAAILCGGEARRFGGRDKATLTLNGRRLVDHVLTGLQSQVDRVILSGGADYGLPICAIPDLDGGPKGPVGGIFSLYRYLSDQDPACGGFLTVPVDAPYFPGTLFQCLQGPGSSICRIDGRENASLAYWALSDLKQAFKSIQSDQSPALMWLADATKARRVPFDRAHRFSNVNTKEDLDALEQGD